MLFPPAPKKNLRFVLLFFPANCEGGRKKRKGVLKKYVSSFVIILGPDTIEFSSHYAQQPVDFTLVQKASCCNTLQTTG